MDKRAAADEIKSRYAEYLQPAKRRGYICPLCGNGEGADGDGITAKPGTTHLHCWKCGFDGDLIDLYQEYNQCDTGEAFRALREHFGIRLDDYEAPRPPVRREEPPVMERPTPDYRGYFKAATRNLEAPEAQAYLQKRGISLETARRFWLGYDSEWVSPTARARAEEAGKHTPPATPRLIIPTSAHSYLARDTRSQLNETEAKYSKMKEGGVELFNLKALDDATAVYIVEGEIDALSIIEAGCEAVGLGAAGNYRKFLQYLDEHKTAATLILCLDDDAGKSYNTGKECQGKLTEGLDERGIPYIIGSNILSGYNDPNEALVADRGAFVAAVTETAQAIQRPDSVSNYISRLMAGEIEKFKSGSSRKTGFPTLDKTAGGIHPGLYVLGAISSLGKTTFIHQMADQMAENGDDVLYFSLEMSRLEMVSKSLARITAKTNTAKAVNALAIRGGRLDDVVLDAADDYMSAVGDRMNIVEGNFDCNVGAIYKYVSDYMDRTNTKPVVVVDYLQILPGDSKMTTKDAVEYNVKNLKLLSRYKDIPVFVISSLNRANYMTKIGFESFKESGGIEYTCDVLMGLQLQCLNDPLFDKEGHISEKREKIDEAKRANPRLVELVCIKNRYGISSYKVPFTYYPQFDLFREG